MKILKKLLVGGLCLMLLAVGLTGCDSSGDKDPSGANTSTSTITVNGVGE